MTSSLGTPRGRCDEYSSKVFPSIKKPRFIVLGEERQATEGDACKLRDGFGQFIYGASSKLCFASNNVEPAHTQPNTLFPTDDEVVNLTGLLETKGMSVSSGKQ
jgi:hypothetical protein